ncbi:MAG TPA: helix-turn-helix domain-containing protein, partial [Pyrinomonadaceae bacterium]|nr:helix-turn-helix domain-containing protein [Pyrinomonadaceae bacterium]
NTHANLEDLWGRPGLQLRERLCAAVTSQQRFQIMESALRSRLHSHINGQRRVKFALEMFGMGGNGALVQSVSRELGFSQRRFIHMFNSHVGLTPKVFCRILRFQRARVLAEKLETPDWAELAVACGYFDQSHLIKDFKEFAGSTPNIYSVQQHHKDGRLKDNHVPLRIR